MDKPRTKSLGKYRTTKDIYKRFGAMGVIAALRTIMLGIVMLVFIMPSLLTTLIPQLAVNAAGKPWGNIILLFFSIIGTILFLAILNRISKVIFQPSQPEIELSPSTLNLFEKRRVRQTRRGR